MAAVITDQIFQSTTALICLGEEQKPRLHSHYCISRQPEAENHFKSTALFRYLCTEFTWRESAAVWHSVHSDICGERMSVALWRPGTSVEYRTISHLFAVNISTASRDVLYPLLPRLMSSPVLEWASVASKQVQ